MRKALITVIASLAGNLALGAQPPVIDRSVMRPYEAQAVAVSGDVSRVRDREPWVVSTGEHVAVRQVITTGNDGYARFTVMGGSSFEIFGNSRVIFRQNTARVGDLLDVLGGRVRVHLQPTLSQPQQRIFTPAATIMADRTATVAVSIDEDQTARIDVMEGEVRVQHTKLPKADPTVVRAIDAILVRPNEPISRRVDRGSLYRYTVKSLKDIWSAVTPGHGNSRDGDVIEGNKMLAESSPHS